MPVVQRPMAAAEAGGRLDRLANIGARPFDRTDQRQTLRQARGDRRGEGASGTMRMARGYSGVLEQLEAVGGQQDVRQPVAREMSALHKHRCGTEPDDPLCGALHAVRSEEHTSELQSLMRISYAVFCLTKTNKQQYL